MYKNYDNEMKIEFISNPNNEAFARIAVASFVAPLDPTIEEISDIKTAVSEASDVREDKVAELKAKIQAGTYSVNPDDFASKLLEKYNAIL